MTTNYKGLHLQVAEWPVTDPNNRCLFTKIDETETHEIFASGNYNPKTKQYEYTMFAMPNYK
jgi:hypothetical protein